MGILIKKRLLERIKERLELVLPNFIFNVLLGTFRKFKSGLKLIIPRFFRQIIGNMQRRIICECVNFKYRNYPEESLAKLYNRDYHRVYINNSDEIKLKKWQAVAIQRAIPELRKVLVAGCSGGGLVIALRNIGIESYGFDISPDLDRIVMDEVRPYIKHGSILNIPFSTSNNFDAFIAVDVFEHIPMKQIDTMINEINRINAKYMITVINHFDFQHVGHITMKSLSWWQKKFKDYYQIDKNINFLRKDIPLLYSLNNNPEHKFLFWKKIN